MNQSDRIRYAKEYINNPLRKEYEAKEKEIMKNKPMSYRILTAISFFPLFMILGYLVIFVILQNGWIILLGIINLPVAVFLPILLYDDRMKKVKNYNENALQN